MRRDYDNEYDSEEEEDYSPTDWNRHPEESDEDYQDRMQD